MSKSVSPSLPVSQPFQEVQKWGRLIKFSHSIFALPFALSIGVVAAQRVVVPNWKWIGIAVALVAARTAAMAFNRLLDRNIDARNPRTRERELPSGTVSVVSASVLFVISAVVFLLSALALGTHCAVLAPFVLAYLCFYSWTKRFTSWSHVVLGVALAMAPGGVWYAFVATIEWEPIVLMLGVAMWVAGFDVLYSCQDAAFDAAEGLFSLPAKVGVERALRIAWVFHLVAIAFFVGFGLVAGLGLTYYVGLLGFSMLLMSQHRLVSANDLTRIDAAFFTRNGIASVAFFLVICLDRLLVS